jgi:dTDP-4-amino-4,6-dideoxygalactose transaminase
VPIAERIFLSPPHLSEREAFYITEALRSNYVAPVGPALNEFEARLAEQMRIPHCVAVSSGTAALHLALRIIGIGSSDEVWAPTLTFMGGISPIVFQNATPVFFDCDTHGLINLDLVEEELNRGRKLGLQPPKALIVTDLYGLPVDIERARAICASFDISLIADSAEALGSSIRGKPSGKGADFVILSFNGNKIITTSGGGALLSDNAQYIEKARFLSTQAREPVPHYEHKEIGYNYRLSNICAAIGIGQLESLSQRIHRKAKINESYRANLSDLPGISFLETPPQCEPNHWLSVVFFDPALAGITPEQVRIALEAANIESRPLWKPMHLQPVFVGTKTVGGNIAQSLFDTGLCLPSGSSLTDSEQNRITSVIRKLFETT